MSETVMQAALSQSDTRLIVFLAIGLMIVLFFSERRQRAQIASQDRIVENLIQQNSKFSDIKTGLDTLVAVNRENSANNSNNAKAQSEKMDALIEHARQQTELNKQFTAGITRLTEETQVANAHTVNYHKLMDDNMSSIRADIEGLKSDIDKLVKREDGNEAKIDKIFETLDRIWVEVSKKGTGEIATNGIQ